MARLDPTRPLESTVLFMDLTTILAVVFLRILQVAGDGLQSRQLPGLLLNLHVTNTNTHFTVCTQHRLRVALNELYHRGRLS